MKKIIPMLLILILILSSIYAETTPRLDRSDLAKAGKHPIINYTLSDTSANKVTTNVKFLYYGLGIIITGIILTSSLVILKKKQKSRIK